LAHFAMAAIASASAEVADAVREGPTGHGSDAVSICRLREVDGA